MSITVNIPKLGLDFDPKIASSAKAFKSDGSNDDDNNCRCSMKVIIIVLLLSTEMYCNSYLLMLYASFLSIYAYMWQDRL